MAGQEKLRLPARRYGPLGSFLIRVGIAVACLVVTTVLVYVERSGYKDANGLPITPLDALYYATVTLSTTGYGDIVPVTEAARLTNVLVITPLRFVFLITLVGTTVEVLTRRSRDEFRARRWRSSVKDHTVVIGYGVKGRSAVQALVDQGTPADRIVVVSPSRAEIEEATAKGSLGIVGDGTREQVLRDAAVPAAARVVVATDRDDTSVLVTLTARRLSPAATLVASAREAQNIPVLKQSGADVVIPTAESAGRLLGLSLISPVAGGLVEDLLEPNLGLEIVERDITAEELGVPPESLQKDRNLVLAVVRDGAPHRFDEGAVKLLQLGDRVVVVRPAARA
ncbi:MAG: Ion channel protein [Frankiales bacterium]|nr:Ion channel protein [Frankiales bacterium]